MRFLWPAIGLCACWWTVARCAGESDASTVSQIPQWRLGQRPVIDIGVASGDPVYELTDAASSLRLDDGGVVIADLGVGELRYFDADGRYRLTAESHAPPVRTASTLRGRLRPSRSGTPGVAFEGAGRRLTFDGEGRVIGEAAGSEPTARIHRRTLILGGTREAQSKAVEALDRMPAVDSAVGYRIVRLDDAGYLWVEGRESDESVRRSWVIHDPQGRTVGRAATLASFEPHQIGPDFILGRWRDGNGIEHIRMYTLDREERVTRADSSAVVAVPAIDPARRTAALIAIRRTLQELAMQQEGYWAKRMTYAADVVSFELPRREGVEVAVIAAGVGGWRALAYVHAADAMCAIGVGREGVAGWEDGRAVCY